MHHNDFTKNMLYIQKKIDKLIEQQDIPNIMFYGKNNKAKHELYQYVLRQLYDDACLKQKYVLYIDCISTKGIRMIKDNIKLFSMQLIHKKNNVRFKTIILDHAEYLTYDSQYSLRRTIEQFSHNTRFLCLCEDIDKLLSPLVSRFLQIYVPESVFSSNVQRSAKQKAKNKQLYSTRFVSQPSISKSMQKTLKSHVETFHSIVDTEDQSNIMKRIMKLSQAMYEDNICAIELLPHFTDNQNYNVLTLVFPHISTQIKNETLIIFYVLNVFRNNRKLEIYDLY